MNKNKLRRNRPDMDGIERGLYNHNRKVLRKTSMVCALCGMPLDKSLKYPDPMSISIDHIIPVALGGKSTLDNLQATHLICNKEKGKRIIPNEKTNRMISNNKSNGLYVDEKNNNFNKFTTTTGSPRLPQYIDWSSYNGE